MFKPKVCLRAECVSNQAERDLALFRITERRDKRIDDAIERASCVAPEDRAVIGGLGEATAGAVASLVDALVTACESDRNRLVAVEQRLAESEKALAAAERAEGYASRHIATLQKELSEAAARKADATSVPDKAAFKAGARAFAKAAGLWLGQGFADSLARDVIAARYPDAGATL